MITFILLVVGGLNWLLFGLTGNDVGSYLLGGMSTTASTVVYVLVGVAAIVEIITHKRACKMCGGVDTAATM